MRTSSHHLSVQFIRISSVKYATPWFLRVSNAPIGTALSSIVVHVSRTRLDPGGAVSAETAKLLSTYTSELEIWSSYSDWYALDAMRKWCTSRCSSISKIAMELSRFLKTVELQTMKLLLHRRVRSSWPIKIEDKQCKLNLWMQTQQATKVALEL